jgi:ribonuclease VapC
LFVDASAAAAIILDEADRAELRRKLKSSRPRFMSPLADYETVLAVRRSRKITLQEASALLESFKRIFAIQDLVLNEHHTPVALAAFERFGKGQSHKASLNMGDCFAYACSKVQKVPLLFKGDDFIHTDVLAVKERP